MPVDDLEIQREWDAVPSLRNDSGLEDVPGTRVVGPKGKYPHCAGYRPRAVA